MIASLYINLGGGKVDWINDGFCDDMNNNNACNYDDGDCCGTLTDKRFCLECKCLCKSKLLWDENFPFITFCNYFAFLDIRFHMLSGC